ncbi:hypothetical protein Tsubulata_040633, partial [Turnera subulata]
PFKVVHKHLYKLSIAHCSQIQSNCFIGCSVKLPDEALKQVFNGVGLRDSNPSTTFEMPWK